MPNHIKNKIELFGTPKDIQNLFSTFNTFHDSTPRTTHDDRLIFKHSTTGEYGWLNTETNEFERRNKGMVTGVPNDFEQEFDEPRNHFPDFNKIIPMPESLNITSGSMGEEVHQLLFGTVQAKYFPLSIEQLRSRFAALNPKEQREAAELAIQYEDNLKKYGHTTWYDWCIENWGTKWNSYDCVQESDTVFTFETAWSGVPKLIQAMSEKFPTVKILYKYSDEDTGSNCGIGEFENGSTTFIKLKNSSLEAYELAFELRPDCKEYFKLVEGEYKYNEDAE